MKRRLPLAALAAAVLLAALPAFASSSPAECATPATAVEPAGEADLDALFPDANEPEQKVCIFICEPWFQTSMYWGIGSDCTASRNNLSSQVSAEATSTGPGLCNGAGAAFGYCGWNLVITAACHWDWGHMAYVTDGYGNIKCKDYC
jgi:hypothetical protein